jgi:hypothetical protein
MQDGGINVFNLEAQLGNVTVNSGPFMVTLEFQNPSSAFGPSIGMDGSGCQAGKNSVKANPGGWSDACALGVPGDWVIMLVYRQACPTGVDEEFTVSSVPALLMHPRPNPLHATTELEFHLAEAGRASLAVFDIQGREVARLADREYSSGKHSVAWNGAGFDGRRLTPGVYLVELVTRDHRTVRKVTIAD